MYVCVYIYISWYIYRMRSKQNTKSLACLDDEKEWQIQTEVDASNCKQHQADKHPLRWGLSIALPVARNQLLGGRNVPKKYLREFITFTPMLRKVWRIKTSHIPLDNVQVVTNQELDEDHQKFRFGQMHIDWQHLATHDTKDTPKKLTSSKFFWYSSRGQIVSIMLSGA